MSLIHNPTPLHYAAPRGHRDVAFVRLAVGADPFRVTLLQGSSPRVIANNVRHFDVSLLLAAAEVEQSVRLPALTLNARRS